MPYGKSRASSGRVRCLRPRTCIGSVAQWGPRERRSECRAKEPSTRHGAGRQRSRRLHCHSVSHGVPRVAHSSRMGLSAGEAGIYITERLVCFLFDDHHVCSCDEARWPRVRGYCFGSFQYFYCHAHAGEPCRLTGGCMFDSLACWGLFVWLFLMGSPRAHVRQVGSSKLSM